MQIIPVFIIFTGMYPQPVSYTVTKEDIAAVAQLGFTIANTAGTEPLYDFINRCFANFNIAAWLNTVTGILTPLAVTPLNREIRYNSQPQELKIQLTEIDGPLIFKRRFIAENELKIAYHDHFALPVIFQDKGLVKKVLKESIRHYLNVPFNEIYVYAGLTVGGYAWAKFNFAAIYRHEVEQILKIAENQLNTHQFSLVKRFFDGYYDNNPHGKAFPMLLWAELPFMKPVLMGARWHGVLNLQNSEQITNFMKYAG